MTMRLVAAELVESREILPGQWLQSFHAPELAVGARAGQFVEAAKALWSSWEPDAIAGGPGAPTAESWAPDGAIGTV